MTDPLPPEVRFSASRTLGASGELPTLPDLINRLIADGYTVEKIDIIEGTSFKLEASKSFNAWDELNAGDAFTPEFAG